MPGLPVPSQALASFLALELVDSAASGRHKPFSSDEKWHDVQCWWLPICTVASLEPVLGLVGTWATWLTWLGLGCKSAKQYPVNLNIFMDVQEPTVNISVAFSTIV